MHLRAGPVAAVSAAVLLTRTSASLLFLWTARNRASAATEDARRRAAAVLSRVAEGYRYLRVWLVDAMVELRRGLEIGLVAEGIETEAERTALAEAGCDLLQGFLIGRPGPLT